MFSIFLARNCRKHVHTKAHLILVCFKVLLRVETALWTAVYAYQSIPVLVPRRLAGTVESLDLSRNLYFWICHIPASGKHTTPTEVYICIEGKTGFVF